MSKHWATDMAIEMTGGAPADDEGVLGNAVILDTPWQKEITKAKEDFLALVKAKGRRWLAPMGRPLAEMAAKKEPPRPWLLQGLFREASVVVLGGKPKGSKSWAKQEIVSAVARGEKAFGEFRASRAGAVLTFDIETDEVDLGARARAQANGYGISIERAFPNVRYEAREHINLLDDDDCAVIIASARAMDPMPALICLDPLRDCFEGEETNELLSTVMKRLRAIRELTNAAILVVHHLVKSNPDAQRGKVKEVGSIFDRFRGGGSLRGAWDAGIGFETLYRGDDGIKSRVEVEVRQGRGAGVFGLDLEFRDDQWGDAVFARWSHFKNASDMMNESDEDRARTLLRKWDGRLSATKAATELEVRKPKAAELLDALVKKGVAEFFDAGPKSGYEWSGGDEDS